MTPYNTDLTQVLKWLQADAPNIQALITKKAEWYDQYNEKFWSDWQKNVFDINTCNAFGLCVWCAILGIPSELFDLSPSYLAFAFGENRENFVADASNTHANPNTTGGNFAGANGAVTDLEEIRIMVKLRYATLVSNGRVIYINRMLRHILNNGEPWVYSSGKYAYILDAAYSPDAAGSDMWKIKDWQYPESRSNFPQGTYISKVTDSEVISQSSVPVAGKVTYNPTFLTQDTETTTSPDSLSQVPILRLASTRMGNESRRVTIATDNVSVPAVSSYSCTFFIKNVLNQRYFGFGVNLAYGTNNVSLNDARIDLQNETITQAGGTFFSATIKRLSNGWYKVVTNASLISQFFPVIDDAVFSIEVRASNSQYAAGITAAAIPDDGNYSDIAGFAIWGANIFQYADNVQHQVPPYFNSNSTDGYVYHGESAVDAEHRLTILDETGYYEGSTVVTWRGVADGVNYPTDQATMISDTPPYKSFVPNVSFIAPVDNEYGVEYRFGPNLGLSSTFVTLLNDRENQLMPQIAGVPYKIVQEV